jgi:hypothetical protein
VLIQAGAMVNGMSIVRELDAAESFIYYHVELDKHSLILAEGVPTETFVDNVGRHVFNNWPEHDALYPAGKLISEMPYPRIKSFRQIPKRLRMQLAWRAQALHQVADIGQRGRSSSRTGVAPVPSTPLKSEQAKGVVRDPHWHLRKRLARHLGEGAATGCMA